MTAPRHTFWDYPSDERDISSTKTYRLAWLAYRVAGLAKAQAMDGLRFGIALAATPVMIFVNPKAQMKRLARPLGRIGVRLGTLFSDRFLRRVISDTSYQRLRKIGQRLNAALE